MASLRFLIPSVAATLAALTLPSGAQVDSAMQPKDCLIAPQDGDEALVSPHETLDPTDDPTLSETLGPCDGVLIPGPIGDDEMTVAPPEGGETPVIEPEDLPPQPQGE